MMQPSNEPKPPRVMAANAFILLAPCSRLEDVNRGSDGHMAARGRRAGAASISEMKREAAGPVLGRVSEKRTSGTGWNWPKPSRPLLGSKQEEPPFPFLP